MKLSVLSRLKQVFYFIYGYWIAKAYRKASAKTLGRLQKKRFNKLIKVITDKAPFYKPFKRCVLNDLPKVDKTIFLQNFDAINTLGLRLKECETLALKAEISRNFRPQIKGVSLGLSSGTTQQRAVFLCSANEQALWAGYIIAKNVPFSLKKKKVALFLRSNNNLYEASKGLLIDFRYFDLTKAFKQLITDLESYDPHILIAPAHVLGQIAEHCAEITPSKVISVAEVLETSTKALIEQQFRCNVDEIYQATEGYIASSCSHGSLHINEDILIVEKEWIDKNSGRFFPIITDLNRTSLPIIRFRLNDILVEDSSPCPCGSSFTRLNKIEGREDDIIWLPDSNTGILIAVFPDLVRRAMVVCNSLVLDYRIQQIGMQISIAYSSETPTKAQQDITNTLTELFLSQNLKLPQLRFTTGVTHNMTEKLRRIACKKKPATLE